MENAEQHPADISLFFTDGWVVGRERVLISAKLNALAEEYFSRVLYWWDGNWFTSDITDSVHSVCYDSTSDLCLWLGQGGTVTGKRRGMPATTDRIADADRYGNLNRIRPIGDQVFICGYGGQVYRRVKSAWVHADENMLISNPDARSVDLLDIDGTGPDNIYAVGTGGAMFHYDGRKWTSIDSPTNLHLTRVRCLSNDQVYVCGYRGTVLRGHNNIWDDLSDPEIQDNFYGLETFGDDVYLARNTGLVRLSRESLVPVDFGTQKVATFHRLHSNDGVLWSFGTDNLLYFDGAEWKEVVPPHNRK